MIKEKKCLIGTIFSDYETWADVYNYNGVLYCVYTETVDNIDHSETSIVVSSSNDEGNTWNSEILPFQKNGVPFWCRPKFLKGNTDQLIIFINLVENIQKSGEIYMIEYNHGKWNSPKSTDVYGILSGNPIALFSGKILLPVHSINHATMYYQQYIYQSNDMRNWRSATSISKKGYDFGDAQIVEINHEIVILIREKTVSGWDLFILTSNDNGEQWNTLNKVAFKCGGKFSTGVNGDNLYMVFCRDKYLDYRKTLCISCTDINLLLKNYKTALFYALTSDGEFKTFSSNNIGYTGIDFINNFLVAVNVRKKMNKHNTLIEIQIRELDDLHKSMGKYQITSFRC